MRFEGLEGDCVHVRSVHLGQPWATAHSDSLKVGAQVTHLAHSLRTEGEMAIGQFDTDFSPHIGNAPTTSPEPTAVARRLDHPVRHKPGNGCIMVSMNLPYDGSLLSIQDFFAAQGFRVVVHRQSPPEPTPDEVRRVSTVERRARRRFKPAYWADLEQLVAASRVRWYGGGDNEEGAVRSARKRWRVEQEGSHPPNTFHLP